MALGARCKNGLHGFIVQPDLYFWGKEEKME
jgi:hypothetical protein